ncbi:MAG: phosphonate ABC transporter, permease protein PhnE [Trueperaceae bacterium]|nr:phosphonate ABC transporter, permease protein PhnE [Trueperaceae bacterium]
MTAATRAEGQRRWAPRPLIANRTARWLVRLLVLAYLAAVVATVDVNWVRVAEGIERSGRLLGQFLRPDFASRWSDSRIGILESVTMSLVATVAGVLIAIPVSLGAARNLAPLPLYLATRAYITLSRTFPEVIVAIVFVVMMGFGPFAGLLTLTFASVGFVAKLLAEDIEDIDDGQLEAMRATGATWWQVVAFAVVPQVMPRFVGLSVYRLDINFRESTILGIVGAGGVGATLTTAMSRYDFDSAGAILILVIAIVLVLEYLSGYVRSAVR